MCYLLTYLLLFVISSNSVFIILVFWCLDCTVCFFFSFEKYKYEKNIYTNLFPWKMKKKVELITSLLLWCINHNQRSKRWHKVSSALPVRRKKYGRLIIFQNRNRFLLCFDRESKLDTIMDCLILRITPPLV